MLIFRDAELRSRILKVALPAMAEMLLYTIIGLVDIAFVGRLGAAPLAAVGLGAEIFFSVVFFLEALGIGAAILVAQSKGAGNREDADRITGYTYFIGLLMGLLAGYLGLRYSPAILGFFPLEAEVSAYVIGYLNITFLIAPLAVMVYMSGTVFRGLGRTDIPMKIALLANVVNIFGDYVLVFGKWGFPQMGVAGPGDFYCSYGGICGYQLPAVFGKNGNPHSRAAAVAGALELCKRNICSGPSESG